MKLTTKLTVKVFLIISLFCSTAFADGEMNEGGRTGTGTGGGGFACIECVIDNESTDKVEDDSIITLFKDFLSEILG